VKDMYESWRERQYREQVETRRKLILAKQLVREIHNHEADILERNVERRQMSKTEYWNNLSMNELNSTRDAEIKLDMLEGDINLGNYEASHSHFDDIEILWNIIIDGWCEYKGVWDRNSYKDTLKAKREAAKLEGVGLREYDDF
jgi:hypothetical protein